MDPSPITYDVIIIGAGISGLYAAHKLQQDGLSVLVLEGRNRIAGRQYTYRDASVDYVDMGAAYIGKTQTFLLDLLKELGLETYEVRTDLKSTLSLRSGKQAYESGVPSFTNPLILLDLNNIIRYIDDLSKEICFEAPWLSSRAEEFDNISVADFVRKHIWTHASHVLAKIAVQTPFLGDWKKVSMLDFLSQVQSCGGIIALTTIKGGLQEMKVKGGSGSVSERLFAKLKGGTVRLNEKVTQINQNEDTVNILTKEGIEYRCKRIISTSPIPALQNIEFSPPLKPTFRQYIDADFDAHGTKTFMFYKTQFWREKGLNGELVSEDGIITYCCDDTKPDGSHPCIMGFINTVKATEYFKLPQEKRKELIMKQYAEEFGLPEFLEPINYMEKSWADEEEAQHGKKCCVWTLPPGVLTKSRELQGQPHGNVFFAGTEMTITFRGYMEGALRSAHATCALVLESLGKDSSAYDKSVVKQRIAYNEMGMVERWLPSVPQALVLLCLLPVLFALCIMLF